MIKEIKGAVSAGKANYAIVVSRFNEFITSRLLGGAVDCLQRHGASDEQITVVWVVGQINFETGVPALFGVLTCETIEQAIERAGTKQGNAGAGAALSAMEMVNLLGQI